jgi:hypothetical protein
VAVDPTHLESVSRLAEAAGVPCRDIGSVGGDRLLVETGGERLDLEVAELHKQWQSALPRALEV